MLPVERAKAAVQPIAPLVHVIPEPLRKASFASIYDRSALYDAALRVYTKPLFFWHKAASMSHDGRTLYDFAQHGPQNLERLHCALLRQEFHFREGLEATVNRRRKPRTVYIFPWEERIVDQLLFQALNKLFHSAFSAHSYAFRHRGYSVDICEHRIAAKLAKTLRPVYMIKRDIVSFFASVDHDIVLKMLERWVEPHDYLYQLLRERVKFQARTEDGVRFVERGVPFGTATACFLGNLYLTPLDSAMSALRGLAYFRYSDDILAFSHERDIVLEARERFQRMLATLKMRSKASHEQNFVLGACDQADAQFINVSKFGHLGLEFRADGSVALSPAKARKVRNLFGRAFRRAENELARRQEPEPRARFLIARANSVLEGGCWPVALIDHYLKHVVDEKQLRLIDRWLAEEVLARVFQKGHRRGNFALLSFKRLREMGLPSLCHRRRLLRHGRLKSSFFRLQPDPLIEKEMRRREALRQIGKERRRLSGLATFSPCLEAPAAQQPRENGGRV